MKSMLRAANTVACCRCSLNESRCWRTFFTRIFAFELGRTASCDKDRTRTCQQNSSGLLVSLPHARWHAISNVKLFAAKFSFRFPLAAFVSSLCRGSCGRPYVNSRQKHSSNCTRTAFPYSRIIIIILRQIYERVYFPLSSFYSRGSIEFLCAFSFQHLLAGSCTAVDSPKWPIYTSYISIAFIFTWN